MIVLKFGGTSVGTASNIRNVLDIVRRAVEQVNHHFEQAIRRRPDQWVWMRKRWPEARAAEKTQETHTAESPPVLRFGR